MSLFISMYINQHVALFKTIYLIYFIIQNKVLIPYMHNSHISYHIVAYHIIFKNYQRQVYIYMYNNVI